MAVKGHKEKDKGALYHKITRRRVTDVIGKAACRSRALPWAGAVGRLHNDGWPDLYVTCSAATSFTK